MSDIPSHNLHNNPADTPHNTSQQAGDDVASPIIVDEYGQPIRKTDDATNKEKSTQDQILDRVKTSERWMILLTAIVAGTTVFQTIQSCNNNKSTSIQVDRVIGAANHIGAASDRFSGSAESINQGIGNAVTQLQNQAAKMDVARTSAEKNSTAAQKAGKQPVFVFGRLDYDDVFGKPHWSTYCTHLTRSLTWENCSFHNEADEDDDKKK